MPFKELRAEGVVVAKDLEVLGVGAEEAVLVRVPLKGHIEDGAVGAGRDGVVDDAADMEETVSIPAPEPHEAQEQGRAVSVLE